MTFPPAVLIGFNLASVVGVAEVGSLVPVVDVGPEVVDVELVVEVEVEPVIVVAVTTGTRGWAETSSPAAATASHATEVAAAVAASQIPM
jgi:hypothetical protein